MRVMQRHEAHLASSCLKYAVYGDIPPSDECRRWHRTQRSRNGEIAGRIQGFLDTIFECV
jgi:hypothetical protein